MLCMQAPERPAHALMEVRLMLSARLAVSILEEENIL